MTSTRPYLLRAMYQWVLDNGFTPYLLVDARVAGVQVPAHAVEDGKIVLNLAPRAVSNLELGDADVTFMARFSGVSEKVRVPLTAARAIYAQENGQGMMFAEEDGPATDDADAKQDGGPAASNKPARGAPHLRIIK